MTAISTILREKGGQVETVLADTGIAEAVSLLAQKRIGALVVLDARKRLSGIISERDIVRALAEHGAAALDMDVGSLMTRKVVTCIGEDTVDEVMGVMTSGRFRHAPVMEGDSLVGLVSIGDVVKYKIAEATAEAEALKTYISAG
ncbi:MAG: CBS domain-containing protein [Alphaproteobacteria bacterium]|nr:CBS domain-containing protein [Alphaproteobacteria bacterium]MDX5370075.1 CBS domain-containing protein [Alphaproteobacteria bacterium]MDX5464648.1 CBS domain-containing protein [Alphaproteobacteria bacterium]